ncbi:MAG: type II toxin-antitoxin system VapC family toxin [Rickettsiales bacterium]|nr:type II toxin-antitoxin system VapC family toxin [Rickettsiales bacterium]
MKKIVLDSSVFNKLFLDEEDRKLAVNLIRNSEDKKFIIPSIFIYEVLSVASSYKISIEKTYALIKEQQLVNFEILEMSDELLKIAEKICNFGNQKSGFPSFYDSVYHALAIINNCDFITADKKHYQKSKKFGHIKLLSQVV